MSQTATAASVIVERHGGVALVRMNEPKTLNALSPGIKAGMIAAVPELTGNPDIRAIVLTGAGRAFCAGGDLRSMTDHATVAVRRRMQATHDWVRRLLTCEKPVLTAVNGVAAGAGFSIALFGDIVYAAEDARFKAGFPNVGASPDLGLCYTLPRAVGSVRAADLMLTNRDVSAAEALAMGLVARLFAPERLVEEVMAIADAMARGPTVSLGMTKRLMARAYESSLESFLEQEAFGQMTAFGSDDFREGVAAFLEKRKPQFRGA